MKGNKRTKQRNEFHGQKEENTFHSFVPVFHCFGSLFRLTHSVSTLSLQTNPER